MNILIINAFGDSPNGKVKFNSFLNLIKKIFKKISENSGIENFNYIIRNPSKLEDYIFNFYSNPTDETSESQNRKNFNSLDMVFIDGIESYSPWKKRSYFLCKFIELCKLSNKVLYAGGVALEILIYYLSIGEIHEYNIINSNGEIKALEEVNKIPIQFFKGIKKNEILLDFVTGDLLEYRKNDKFWEPIMNIGLHHQITAEKYFSRGKFVLNENFKGKDYIKNENAIKSYCKEIKVKIVRQYVSHYLVNNCPIEFISICSLEWFPHNVNVTAKRLQFRTICQSEKGSIVIEHENTIGVAFHPLEKFKDSVKILENFIKKKFNEVKDKLLKIKNVKLFINTNTNKEIAAVFKAFKDNDDRLRGKFDPDEEILTNPYSLVGKVTTSSLFNRVKKVKYEAKHVGEGINNREMIFVENNYINQRPFYSFRKRQKNKKDKNQNNKNNQIRCLSSVDNKKRQSCVSNSSHLSINSFRNKKPAISLDKKILNRGSTTVKRKKKLKNLKELDNINDFNNLYKNNNNNNLFLKIQAQTNYNNNHFEISKNSNNDDNNKFFLNKFIRPKTATNRYKNLIENEQEGQKEEKKNENNNDIKNNESKYPRLPTLNELEYLLNNTKSFKIRNFDFKNSNLNIEQKLLENDKKDKILNYTSKNTFFLKKNGNNEERKNSVSIKKKFNLKSSSNYINNKKEYNNNRYNTFRPMIDKKYEINKAMKIIV